MELFQWNLILCPLFLLFQRVKYAEKRKRTTSLSFIEILLFPLFIVSFVRGSTYCILYWWFDV